MIPPGRDFQPVIDRQGDVAGWCTPQHEPNQRTLFPEPREEVLDRLRVSSDEASAWYMRGWLSFDAGAMREIDAPELHEITFIAMLVRSFLTEDQIGVLLSHLSKPYRYDHRAIAYHFSYGWVEPQEPDEVPFEEQFDGWIEQQVFEENVTALWELIEKAQTAIKRVQLADGVE